MRIVIFVTVLIMMGLNGFAQGGYERDTIPTTGGDLVITFLGHGSLMFSFQEKNIYIDPVGQVADFSQLPKADAILVTHEHGDHLDKKAIDQLKKEGTELYVTELGHSRIQEGKVIRNDDFFLAAGVPVVATAAYNIVNRRGNGVPYHPKGDGNGYVLDFGQTRLYVAGDTEIITEMKHLGKIDIAFLPVALPYTMSVPMAVQALGLIKPSIFYPYHLNETDPDELVRALLGSALEVRIRKLK